MDADGRWGVARLVAQREAERRAGGPADAAVPDARAPEDLADAPARDDGPDRGADAPPWTRTPPTTRRPRTSPPRRARQTTRPATRSSTAGRGRGRRGCRDRRGHALRGRDDRGRGRRGPRRRQSGRRGRSRRSGGHRPADGRRGGARGRPPTAGPTPTRARGPAVAAAAVADPAGPPAAAARAAAPARCGPLRTGRPECVGRPRGPAACRAGPVPVRLRPAHPRTARRTGLHVDLPAAVRPDHRADHRVDRVVAHGRRSTSTRPSRRRVGVGYYPGLHSRARRIRRTPLRRDGPVGGPQQEEVSRIGSPASPQVSAPTSHRVSSVLAIPAFRRLWMVTAITSTGEWLSVLALSALATQLDRVRLHRRRASRWAAWSPRSCCRRWCSGPLAGALADRFDRRKLMVICDMLRFGLLISIPIVGSLWWLFVATFLIELCAHVLDPGEGRGGAEPAAPPGPDGDGGNQLGLVDDLRRRGGRGVRAVRAGHEVRPAGRRELPDHRRLSGAVRELVRVPVLRADGLVPHPGDLRADGPVRAGVRAAVADVHAAATASRSSPRRR